jgi:outer membrane autotransporter protein
MRKNILFNVLLASTFLFTTMQAEAGKKGERKNKKSTAQNKQPKAQNMSNSSSTASGADVDGNPSPLPVDDAIDIPPLPDEDDIQELLEIGKVEDLPPPPVDDAIDIPPLPDEDDIQELLEIGKVEDLPPPPVNPGGQPAQGVNPPLANPGANLPPAQGNVAATVASEPAKVEGFTEAMTSNISSVSQAVSTTAEALSDNLSEVISSRTNEIFSSQDVAVTGAASGEEGSREVGIWVRGFASQGKQGISKDLPSFKTRHSGGIIGLDTMINDANLLGLAYSHAEIKASINDASNSKTNMKVNVLTAYCSSAFADDIFLNSQFKLGKLRVKNTGASQGKPKGTLWGIREELGYKIRLEDNITVTPTIGIAYDETKLNKYADKDGKKDVVVSSKKYTRLNGILGLNIAKAIDLNGLTFVPNIHGNIEHSFRSKASNLKVSSVNDTADSVILPKNKLGKTSYTLGAGVKLINAGKVEIGMNYDMLKRGKFRSHNGSINLRVNL